MMFSKLFAFFVLYLLVVSTVFSQNNEKYKLAESYEKSGDYKNSSRLYLELYNDSPSNDSYFQGVVRSYKALNKYSELLPVIEKRLENKKNSEMYAIYGEILWRTGKTSDANKAWDNAVSSSPKDDKTYMNVASAQIALRLFDKAIVTFEKGRNELKNPYIFSDELGQLYIATGNFDKGTTEVLNMFEQNRNMGIAQGRLSALLNNPSAVNYVSNILKDKAASKDINYKKLYAWFLRSTKKFDEAFNVYKQIDQQADTKGLEMLNFANASQSDGQYDVALKAYEYIIDMGRKSPNVLNALFGFARTLENKFQKDESLTPDKIEDIIKRYRGIIDEFPSSPTSEECRMRIADLYFNHLGDYNKSIKELNTFFEKPGRKPVVANALIMLGDIYVMQDNLNEAEKKFTETARNYMGIYPDGANLAKYKLAEIEYFKGDIDSAQEHFGALSTNTNTDIANDALAKVTLIEQNKELKRALALFAKAELREKQKKYDEAITLYKEASGLSEGNSLSDESIVRASKINYEQKKFVDARKLLSDLLEKNPDSIFNDYAMYMIGNTYFAENNKDMAVKYYSDLLAKYPRSIYLEEARTKIRQIRDGRM